MSVKVDDLVIELTLEDGKYRAAMVGAGNSAQAFANRLDNINRSLNRVERGMGGFVARLRDWVLIIGQARNALHQISFLTLDWVKNIITTSAEMERMTVLMKGLSTATNEAARNIEAADNLQTLINTAQQVPFALNDITNAFVKFKAGGLDPLDGSMQALLDGVAAFGGSSDQLNRASVAIQQMMGKNVISMEELRQQLGEAVPTAIKLMARSMGVSVAELVDQVSEGKVEARRALQGMLGEFELVFGGAGQRLMETFTGQLQRLGTNLIMLKSQSSGMQDFFASVKSGLSGINEYLASPAAMQFASSLGSALNTVTQSIITVVRVMYDWRVAIAAVTKGLIAGLGTRIAIQGVIGLVTAVSGAASMFGNFGRSLTALNTALSGVAPTTLLFGKNVDGLGGSMATVTSISGGTAVGIRGIGAAISGMLGPISLAIAALAALATALDVFGSRYRKTIEQVIEGRQIMSSDNLEEIEAVSSDEKAELRRLQNELAERQSIGAGIGDEDEANRYEIERLEKQIAEKEKLLENYERNRVNLEIKWTKLRGEQIADLEMAATDSRLQDVQAIYNKSQNDLDEQFASAGITHDQYVERSIAELTRMSDTSVQVLQARISAAELELTNAAGEMNAEMQAGLQTLINEANQAIASIKAQVATQISIKQAGLPIVTVPGDEGKPKKSGGGGKSSGERATERLIDLERDLKREAEQARQAFLNPYGYEIPAAIDRVRDRVEQLTRDLPAAAKEMDRLLQIAGVTEADKELAKLSQSTRDLERDMLSAGTVRRLEYEDEVARLMDMRKQYTALGAWREDHEAALNEHLLALQNDFNARSPIGEWMSSWTSAADDVQSAMVDVADGASQAIADMVVSGKADLSSLAESFLATFVQIQAAAGMSAIGDIMSGKGGLMGNIGTSLTKAFVRHDGGQGTGGRTRMVPSALFDTAPRFHSGRLASDEMAAIIRKDERVLTPKQMGALGRADSAPPTINVINQSGIEMTAESRPPRFDGEKWVIDTVMRAANQPGKFRDAIKGM